MRSLSTGFCDKSCFHLKARNSRMLNYLAIFPAFVVLEGINSVYTQTDFRFLPVDRGDDPERECARIQVLLENQTAGRIINTTGQNHEYLFSL